jgi:import inner membrane translocase subunit TIM21
MTHQDGNSDKRWTELSKSQKVIRTARTGADFLTIIVGVVLTVSRYHINCHFGMKNLLCPQGTVLTLLYTEVFAPYSAAVWFNRIHKRIREDSRCVKLLGNGKRIRAYGEPTSNRWARNRPIA